MHQLFVHVLLHGFFSTIDPQNVEPTSTQKDKYIPTLVAFDLYTLLATLVLVFPLHPGRFRTWAGPIFPSQESISPQVNKYIVEIENGFRSIQNKETRNV